MKKALVPIALSILLSPLATADVIGIQAGANYWNYDISGSVRYQTQDSGNDIDVNNDLGFDDDSLGFVYVSFDHPLPLIPNIKISRTNIDSSASGSLSQAFEYGGLTFNLNESVRSDVSLEQTDITVFYRILDNVFNLDLGINAKYIDAESTISGTLSGSESADISGWVPMVYGAVGIDLPFTGLSVGADGSIISYQDSQFYDFTVKVNYTTDWYLGVDAGYRSVRLDLDDFDDSYADVKFDGPYLGAYIKF